MCALSHSHRGHTVLEKHTSYHRPLTPLVLSLIIALAVLPIVPLLFFVKAWRERAHRGIGMDHAQVRELLGDPSRVQHYQGYEPTWEYKQLRGYWSGSHFQVFFIAVACTGWNPMMTECSQFEVPVGVCRSTKYISSSPLPFACTLPRGVKWKAGPVAC